jgi:hypothetical protein
VSEASYDRQKPSEGIAGLLAALAITAAAVGLAWHPLRLIPFAMLISLIAAGMGGRYQRLAFAAVMISAACFFLGMTIAVVAETPLW